MAWKNGGGSTTEIAASPDGAGFDTLDWRVSIADVATDGPFSAFPGIDRSIIILDGAGIVLTVGEGPGVRLTPDSEPLSFPGDAKTSGRLLGGPISDLNVMTRRGRVEHHLRRVKLRKGETAGVEADRSSRPMIVVLSGSVSFADKPGETLVRHDAIVFDGNDSGSGAVVARAAAIVAVIDFYPARRQRAK